ncbi:MAG: hypothetical protein EOM13_09700, partial [Clostridia bacterium]|nr:hypothetical protein [Clostridia bacterium]
MFHDQITGKRRTTMKLAFSTLGCPEWSWVDIQAMARDLGFDGIEIRGLGQEIQAAKARPFTAEELPQTLARLRELNLSLTCFSSDCCLRDADRQRELLAEGFEYIDLAAASAVPYVRILGDLAPEVQVEVDDQVVLRALRSLSDYAAWRGVTLLIETNGVYAQTSRLRQLLESLDEAAVSGPKPSVAVLWDLHHPWRFFSESPAETWRQIGRFVRYVHIKDSVWQDGRIRYRMLGEGDLPIREMLQLLVDQGYDGFVSLEWVKRWSRDLEDAAVVFPAYIYFMQEFLREQDRPASRKTPPVPTPVEGEGTSGGQRIYADETMVDDTIGQLLERVAAQMPDQPAVAYLHPEYRRTYREFLADVDQVARGLLGIGVRKGDHVAIWATNHPQWLLSFFATARIGAVMVTVNTSYKIHEAEYLLRQSDTHTLIMMDGYKDADYVAIIHEICPELRDSRPGQLNSRRLPLLRNVINFTSEQPGCYSWQTLLDLADGIPSQRIAEIGHESGRGDQVAKIVEIIARNSGAVKIRIIGCIDHAHQRQHPHRMVTGGVLFFPALIAVAAQDLGHTPPRGGICVLWQCERSVEKSLCAQNGAVHRSPLGIVHEKIGTVGHSALDGASLLCVQRGTG